MPSRNVVKYYIQDGFYHIYNRGVEKRDIFKDEQDYNVFVNYLKEYLLPKDRDLLMNIIADPQSNVTEKDRAVKFLRLNNFHGQIQMVAYCLMPNHFHFLIKQKDRSAIDRFMNSIGTRYTMYFNKRHSRVGRLYQDVYKAVGIDYDEYLLHLSRYIHKQALEYTLRKPQPSSYKCYLGLSKSEWLYPDEVLSFFSNKYSISYEKFLKQDESPDLTGLLLED